jgi:S-adenosylmethionine:tRNA ribosyltransferase-isomerase
LLVLNDTKVVYARLFFQKPSGATIEIFCLEPIDPIDMQLAFSETKKCRWKCLVGNNKKWKNEALTKTISFEDKTVTLSAERIAQDENAWVIQFEWNENLSFAEILQSMGEVPLPPYLKRKANEEDKTDYQTIYADHDGSVAAPTAGLHFSDKTFLDLKSKNIKCDFVTLHVGAGTFKPVTSETIGEHIMHTERICISRNVIADLLNYCDKKIICVGTTSVRTLESLYWHGVKLQNGDGKYQEVDVKQWEPYNNPTNISTKEALQAILDNLDRNNADFLFGQTQIIIAPSYTYRITNGMVTNFHQPKSTLLLLVSAMIGDKWKEAYDFALKHDYRFLSFGDACLFLHQR